MHMPLAEEAKSLETSIYLSSSAQVGKLQHKCLAVSTGQALAETLGPSPTSFFSIIMLTRFWH